MCESLDNPPSEFKLILYYSYPDAYHSCYILAGLSSTQYSNSYSVTDRTEGRGTLNSAMQWMSNPKDVNADQGSEHLIDEEDRLEAVHPIYVIPWSAVDRCHSHFSQKQSF